MADLKELRRNVTNLSDQLAGILEEIKSNFDEVEDLMRQSKVSDGDGGNALDAFAKAQETIQENLDSHQYLLRNIDRALHAYQCVRGGTAVPDND